jgi:tetratricopeptide (TPR) repeat protein
MKLISKVVKKVEGDKREKKTESNLSPKPLKRKRTLFLLLFIGVFTLVIGEGYLLWSNKNKITEPSVNKPKKSLSLRLKESKSKTLATSSDVSSITPEKDSAAQILSGERIDSIKLASLTPVEKIEDKDEVEVKKKKPLSQTSSTETLSKADSPLLLSTTEKENSKEIPKLPDIPKTKAEDKKEQSTEKKPSQKKEISASTKILKSESTDLDAQKSLSELKPSSTDKLILSTPLSKEDSKSQKPSSVIEKNQMANNYFEFGLKSQRSGNLREAEDCYLKALELDSDFHPARLNLSSIYLEKGRMAEAEKELNRLLSKKSAETKVLYNMALLCYRKKEYKNAEEYLDKLLISEPDNSKAYLLRGKISENQNELRDAIIAYSKAYQIDPNDPQILYSLGRANDLRGEKKEALNYYSLFLKTYSEGNSDLKRSVKERVNFLYSGGKND